MYPFLLRCCHSGPSCDLMLVIKHISGARKHLFLLFPLDFFFFFCPLQIYTHILTSNNYSVLDFCFIEIDLTHLILLTLRKDFNSLLMLYVIYYITCIFHITERWNYLWDVFKCSIFTFHRINHYLNKRQNFCLWWHKIRKVRFKKNLV